MNASVCARRFRGQAESCRELGSPLYGSLLDHAAADIDAGGPVWTCIEPVADLPGGALLALRFMGATHRQALSGAAPDVAARYRSCGGDGDPAGAWEALHQLTERAASSGELLPLLHRGVQTNEVGRSAALLGGFLDVARTTERPLRVLEVGASAGLNLHWDHFRYGDEGQSWGPPDSPVDQGYPWRDGRRPLLRPSIDELEVAERAGCDVAPVDPSSEEGRLTLLSYVWPDMERRFALLDGACRVAASTPAAVEASSADAWLHARLSTQRPGVATVAFHSIVLQYLTTDTRARLLATIAEAGQAATSDAPFAWLRLEPPGALGPSDFEVRLTTWPGGEDRRLGVSHPHGAWVRWEA